MARKDEVTKRFNESENAIDARAVHILMHTVTMAPNTGLRDR